METAERQADGVRTRDGVGHAEAAQRNERHDVERANPPVHAAVPLHVDRPEHGVGQRQHRRLDGARAPRGT